ncbi:MAG: DUF2252 family protein [Acidobacteriia bacterium]|nr:DUF2252 family protein [Terriglobia bacterium]
MKIVKATEKYEAWLRRRLRIVEPDLALKHEQMRSAPFPFLRATYYRWAQIWAEKCPEAAAAPKVLAVGDLHVENFGTWRDSEGRLIWGINDFDEAWPLPYTNDLIRLATSVLLSEMSGSAAEGIFAILKGYRDCLEAGGRPFALAENHPSLREMATARLHQPERYWEKLHALADVVSEPPADALKAIASLMPESGLHWRVVHRVAGLGSLGRERYVALADWRGGSIAREAKALTCSASAWAARRKGNNAIHYQDILDRAVRCRDPFVRLRGTWIVRRLAPDCSRIELAALPEGRDEVHLLHAMGWETANVHLGSRKPRTLGEDLQSRPRGWLLQAARRMEKAILADFAEYN